MRVLVVCPVHDPRDARIAEREIGALLDAGHSVTQVGPFASYGAQPRDEVRALDVPRSQGRNRAAALRKTRRVLAREAPEHDIILLHSPDAVVAAVGIGHPGMVWDVHEDTAAALAMRPWLPGPLVGPVGAAVRWLERRSEGTHRIVLAEHAYASRFSEPHPVVLNTPRVPDRVLPSGRGRAVYLGRVTHARGGAELIGLGRDLSRHDVTLDIIGNADPDVSALLEAARAQGWVEWRGFMANAQALDAIEGATVGVSLLHDQANYRHSMPTKLLEYLARGIPFVSTPLPLAVDLAERSGAGIIVPFGDTRAATDAVLTLHSDGDRRHGMAAAGRAWVKEEANWTVDGPRFVDILSDWAGG